MTIADYADRLAAMSHVQLAVECLTVIAARRECHGSDPDKVARDNTLWAECCNRNATATYMRALGRIKARELQAKIQRREMQC